MERRKCTFWPMRAHRATRTPLMASLRRCFRQSLDHPGSEIPNNPYFQRAGGPDFPDRFSRRDFVKGALALGAASLIPGCKTSAKSGSPPRVAIVGAGIAGLSAAHVLAKSGIAADVYESGARAGGRILTLQNMVAPGLYTEAGGEFIDTAHADMFSLAREFGLEIKDAFGADFS